MYKILIFLLIKLKLLNKINFVLTKKHKNNKFYIPLINGLGLDNFLLTNNWLDDLIASFCKENDCFIDVGINLGQTLIRVKSFNNKIDYIGFEPNAVCCYYLEKLISKNNFNKVRIINTALFDQNKFLSFVKDSHHDSSASVVEGLRPIIKKNEQKVYAIKYDQYFLDEVANFIKIDVEGAELEILRGMQNTIKKNRPIIVCEILDSFNQDVLQFTQKRAKATYDFINSLNYSVIKIEINAGNGKIKSLKRVNKLSVKQWTKSSLLTNDYLFVPTEKIEFFQMILSRSPINYLRNITITDIISKTK